MFILCLFPDVKDGSARDLAANFSLRLLRQIIADPGSTSGTALKKEINLSWPQLHRSVMLEADRSITRPSTSYLG